MGLFFKLDADKLRVQRCGKFVLWSKLFIGSELDGF